MKHVITAETACSSIPGGQDCLAGYLVGVSLKIYLEETEGQIDTHGHAEKRALTA